jgi:hypothetical protein
LAFVGLVAYGLYKVVPVKLNAGQFVDAMQEQATFAAGHSNPQIVNELLERAKDLRLPIRKEQITVNRTRESIAIEAHYQVPISFFGGLWTYTIQFDPIIGRPLVSM